MKDCMLYISDTRRGKVILSLELAQHYIEQYNGQYVSGKFIHNLLLDLSEEEDARWFKGYLGFTDEDAELFYIDTKHIS